MESICAAHRDNTTCTTQTQGEKASYAPVQPSGSVKIHPDPLKETIYTIETKTLRFGNASGAEPVGGEREPRVLPNDLRQADKLLHAPQRRLQLLEVSLCCFYG